MLRNFARRLRSATSLLGVIGAPWVNACVATIEAPEDSRDSELAGTGGGGTSAAGGASAAGSGSASAAGGGSGGDAAAGTAGSGGSGPPACVAALFRAGSGKCSGAVCHDLGGSSKGGLDLASPGVESRLVDQPAKHLDVAPTDVCPTGVKLIDRQTPTDSWLLKKLSDGAFGTCGAKMPATGTLSEGELSCVRAWVESFR